MAKKTKIQNEGHIYFRSKCSQISDVDKASGLRKKIQFHSYTAVEKVD